MKVILLQKIDQSPGWDEIDTCCSDMNIEGQGESEIPEGSSPGKIIFPLPLFQYLHKCRHLEVRWFQGVEFLLVS